MIDGEVRVLRLPATGKCRPSRLTEENCARLAVRGQLFFRRGRTAFFGSVSDLCSAPPSLRNMTSTSRLSTCNNTLSDFVRSCTLKSR
jgi:hypothetical protein